MDSTQVERLRAHAEQLAMALLREAGPDGVIHTEHEDGSVYPDLAATHHLVEVLTTLEPSVFAEGISAAVGWLLDPQHACSDHPFSLDCLAGVSPAPSGTEERLRRDITQRQLADGSIPVFTSHVRGGDFFSTLWAVKILGRFSPQIFRDEIDRAIQYLIEHRTIGCTTIGQAGFLALMLAKYRPAERGLMGELRGTLISALEGSTPTEEGMTLCERLFLLEDLLYLDATVGGVSGVVDEQLRLIFALDTEAKALPPVIAEVQRTCSQSLFLETVARAGIVAAQRAGPGSNGGIGLGVNRLLHGAYRTTRYRLLQSTAQLRAFVERYGSIHHAFQGYDAKLEAALAAKRPRSRCIFLMMPFKESLEYRKLTEVLRSECERHGFLAVRVDDPNRQYCDLLWDNLVVNMLACKYAIAVLVSERVIDRVSDEVRLFANPNIALEFGFFKSRGQDVLILKDKSSALPADLQAFLWEPFDIHNPDTTIPSPLGRWLELLKSREEAGDAGA